LKPSELTSFSAFRVAELALEAGVPEGVFNVINGGPDVGAALARHREIDLLTFTGSTRTGKQLLIAAGESNMKRLVLECGGKSPNIVFEDSPDLAAVAEAVIARAFWNQGQVCTASSRLLVQDSIKDELLRILLDKVATLMPADPLVEGTRLGALISHGHITKVRNYINEGIKGQGRLACGPEAVAPHPKGFYLAPTIFENVSPTETIAQEEIFGPVLSVIPFRDEAEAIQIANQTIYGLSAIVWTKDLRRGHRMTHGINVGWITVNATDKPAGGPGVGVLSVGGHRESGIGTEGGIDALEEYPSRTSVQINV
jgi:acyl-CoA reductase-like NAD-dependent aldehyde dehydrogenase